MARKMTEAIATSEETVTETNAVAVGTVEAVKKKPEMPESGKAGFFCYIGPNLKNLIQTGTIYRGTREQALAKAAEAIKAQPLVKSLIVPGDNTIGSNLQRVKTPGNILYANYQKLAGKEGK